MQTAQEWIDKLNLQPHPEGGYFLETYRSEIMEKFDGFGGVRNVSTAIYFMLTKDNFSAFHRIKSDEMWHFYNGAPVSIYVINKSGELEVIKLGLDLSKGQQPQALVKAGCWFASRTEGDGEYTLTGCTVAPGFDFTDFEMADRVELIDKYPQHEEIIRQLTR